MTGLEAGALADLFIGKVFVKFQMDEFAAAFVESRETEPDKADAFDAGDLFIGERLRIGSVGSGGVGFVALGLERDDFGGIAPVIERQIMHGAIEPPSRLAYLAELSVQLHKRFLDQVLGNFAVARETQGVAQQWRFQGGKQLLNRFGRLRARFLWSAHSHALLMIVLRHPSAPPGFVTGSRWSQWIDTRVRSFLDGFNRNVLTTKLDWLDTVNKLCSPRAVFGILSTNRSN